MITTWTLFIYIMGYAGAVTVTTDPGYPEKDGCELNATVLTERLKRSSKEVVVLCMPKVQKVQK